METIKINKKKETCKGSALQEVIGGHFFDSFVQSQKQGFQPDGSYKKKGITAEGAATLREETCHILTHCNAHNAYNSPETTHLVVGYVQSGKTMSFTALSALAKDNGYRLIVYLAGTKTNLVEQTTARLTKDLIGKNRENADDYKLHKDPKEGEIDEIISQMELSSKPMILIPLLKHSQHIEQLIKLFESRDFKELMGQETVLIIDDEADQASLNAYGRKNSKTNADDVSATYKAILRMRAALPGNTYVQYTATPQANLLISMQDTLSPQSHTLLTPGEGYIGGKLYFGLGENHDLYNCGLIKEIPPKDVFHKKQNKLKKIPNSLVDALMLHVLAIAIVVKWRKTEGINFLSMMVHPDETQEWNLRFKRWIENTIKNWRQVFRNEKTDEYAFLIGKFQKNFTEAIRYYDEEEQPSWEDIQPLLRDIILDHKVYLVNSDKDAEVNIDWNSHCMHILVGAEMLNRGFTIENLATTYMPRYTTGTANADTIQQRCRFFGYKRDYIKSCRVFLPQVSILNYVEYIKHEEELRSMLKSCDSLAEAERKIMLSPRLKPTRTNVLPDNIVKTQLKGICELQAFQSRSLIENNKTYVKAFLEQHKNDFEYVLYKYQTTDRQHRSMELTIEEAINFLRDFRFSDINEHIRKIDTIRYLRYLDSQKIIKYVRFIQMAWQETPLRERSYNKNTQKVTSLLSGQSNDNGITYPGDRKMCDPDTITIQLHHIKFLNGILELPPDAYALTINYPEKIATNYISTKGNMDKEDYSE